MLAIAALQSDPMTTSEEPILEERSRPGPAGRAECPICRARASDRCLQVGQWSYYRCPVCGHRFGTADGGVEPPVQQIYREGYTGFRDDPILRAALHEQVDTLFRSRLPPGGRILDVGCGNGEFLAVACEHGFLGEGIDISPAAVSLCRERGIDAQVGDFLKTGFRYAFDAVTMWDVIAHLPDPAAFVRRARELLRPNGYLVIKTPLVSDRTFRLLTLAPQAARAVLQVPARMSFFSFQSMRRAAELAGLQIVEQRRGGGMRSLPPAGSLRKRLARGAVRAIHLLSGNSNLYVWMRAPTSAAATGRDG